MKISKIILNNFRQYYGNVAIDLDTNSNKNIVIVGGKNGYGKTNFLLSIVWCLYGEKIMQIDESFKREIQKETNYQKFLKQSLNWDSQKEANDVFSVEVSIYEIDLPDRLKGAHNSVIIRREFITDKMEENLFIRDEEGKEIFIDNEDKINFINDYLIPLEAAKFVFFDAEKIASWAELSTKDEGSVLNDALGKLLGLDIYENLKEDLQTYANNLRKEGANTNIKEQIINAEKAIELNKDKIEEIDLKSALNENEIKSLKDKIKDYQAFLNQNSKKETTSLNREDIYNDISLLQEKKEELEKRFNELNELIPLAMLGGKIEEVIEQISIQDKIQNSNEINSDTKQKLEKFIERLFNQPPEPTDGSMTFKNKIFYSDKAQGLLNELFNISSQTNELSYELDLSNADKELIYKTSELLRQHTEELFESTISDFNSVQVQIAEKEKQLKIIDSDLQDETILEIITKKDEAERQLEKFIAENGALENQKDKLLKDNVRLNQQYNILLQKSTGNQIIKDKISTTKKYIDSLQVFIDNQKKSKKDSLAKNLLIELKKLMHKLQSENSRFIEDTKIDILPDGKGLKVSIIDADGKEVPKESFSTGEKQIYISCLIKAILKEAIQNFPIFIDTPLGRLDHEHIENILKDYYPELSNQVVLLATNNEITPRRYASITSKVAKSYLIVNEHRKSNFKNGYFQSYEN
jgi:DNA sulfur modification protein DndD